jgi:hypothetical protein
MEDAMTNPNKDGAQQSAAQPSGQPVGGQWAQQQKKGMEKQDQAGKKNQHQQAQNESSGQQGDNRTPDESIGQVAYADRDPAKKKTGEF